MNLISETTYHLFIVLIISNLLKVLNTWFLKKIFSGMTIKDLIEYEKETRKILFKKMRFKNWKNID